MCHWPVDNSGLSMNYAVIPEKDCSTEYKNVVEGSLLLIITTGKFCGAAEKQSLCIFGFDPDWICWWCERLRSKQITGGDNRWGRWWGFSLANSERQKANGLNNCTGGVRTYCMRTHTYTHSYFRGKIKAEKSCCWGKFSKINVSVLDLWLLFFFDRTVIFGNITQHFHH